MDMDTVMAQTRNMHTLARFKSLALKHFKMETQEFRHLDVGHNKPYHIRMMNNVAAGFPHANFVYYDNSAPEGGDIDRDNVNADRGSLWDKWAQILFGVSPEKIAKKRLVLPKNLTITSCPRGEFNSATYLWTLHEFEGDARKSLEGVYGLLKVGGRIGIMDYALGDLRSLASNEWEGAITKLFDSGNEQVVLAKEGVETCVQMHSQYTPETLAGLVESVGFAPIPGAQKIEYRKFKEKKYPKTYMGFWEKQ